MQLRREKIAERMKNLQELVPNSNKVLYFISCSQSLNGNCNISVLFSGCPGALTFRNLIYLYACAKTFSLKI